MFQKNGGSNLILNILSEIITSLKRRTKCVTIRCVMYLGVECVVCCNSECISTPGKLKNQPDHGGNRTRDLWFASPMLYQLSYEVKYVRVFDIVLDLVAQLVEHWTSKPKVAGSIPTVVRLIFQLAWCGYTLRVTTHYTCSS